MVGPEALKGQSIVTIIVQVVVNLLNKENNLLPTFSSPPVSRGTVLTMELQHPLGFINIKTDLELCFVSQRAKPDRTHNTLQVSASSVNQLHITSEPYLGLGKPLSAPVELCLTFLTL